MPSYSRQPQATVTIAGNPVACTTVEVNQTKKASSSTCEITLPLATLDAAGMGLDWLAEQVTIPLSVSFSAASDDTTMFVGNVDKTTVAMTTSSGQVVTMSGRDVTAQMINAKTNEKFTNQKAEDVASTIAGRHGLTLQTDGGTVLTGKIYTEEQARVTSNQSEWTLLKELAESEGKVLSVFGNNLYFSAIDDSSLPTYDVIYSPAVQGVAPAYSNVTSITLSRNHEAAQNITVNVKSWDHKKKQLISSTATSGSGGDGLVYNYHHHHKTQEQADHHAQSKLAEHSRHEFDISIEMPGDTTLTPLYQINLTGTNSGFDQMYNIDSVRHKIGVSGGYTMSIATKAAKQGRNAS